jgi:hypothetical protein
MGNVEQAVVLIGRIMTEKGSEFILSDYWIDFSLIEETFLLRHNYCREGQTTWIPISEPPNNGINLKLLLQLIHAYHKEHHKESYRSHRCDSTCICPIHKTQLLYSKYFNQHACIDNTCIHAHGFESEKHSLPETKAE